MKCSVHGNSYEELCTECQEKREPLPVRTESTGWANVAGVLIGVGLAMGSGPIILASILMKRNMFIEIIDGLDLMWKRLDASNDPNDQRGE